MKEVAIYLVVMALAVAGVTMMLRHSGVVAKPVVKEMWERLELPASNRVEVPKLITKTA